MATVAVRASPNEMTGVDPGTTYESAGKGSRMRVSMYVGIVAVIEAWIRLGLISCLVDQVPGQHSRQEPAVKRIAWTQHTPFPPASWVAHDGPCRVRPGPSGARCSGSC